MEMRWLWWWRENSRNVVVGSDVISPVGNLVIACGTNLVRNGR